MIKNFYKGLIGYLQSKNPCDTVFGIASDMVGEYVTIQHIAKVDNVCFFGSGSGVDACRYCKIVSQINCWSTADGNYLPSQLSAMKISDFVQKKLFKVYFEVDGARIYGMTIDNVIEVTEEDDAYGYIITATWWLGTRDMDSSSSSSSESSSSESSESSESSSSSEDYHIIVWEDVSKWITEDDEIIIIEGF